MKKIFSIFIIGLLLVCGTLISCKSSSDSGSGSNNNNNNNSKYYGTWKYTDLSGMYKLEILTNTDCQLTLPSSIYPFNLPFSGTCSFASSNGITGFGAVFTIAPNTLSVLPAGGTVTFSGTFTNDTTLHVNPVAQLGTSAADFTKQQTSSN